MISRFAPFGASVPTVPDLPARHPFRGEPNRDIRRPAHRQGTVPVVRIRPGRCRRVTCGPVQRCSRHGRCAGSPARSACPPRRPRPPSRRPRPPPQPPCGGEPASSVSLNSATDAARGPAVRRQDPRGAGARWSGRRPPRSSYGARRLPPFVNPGCDLQRCSLRLNPLLKRLGQGVGQSRDRIDFGEPRLLREVVHQNPAIVRISLRHGSGVALVVIAARGQHGPRAPVGDGPGRAVGIVVGARLPSMMMRCPAASTSATLWANCSCTRSLASSHLRM